MYLSRNKSKKKRIKVLSLILLLLGSFFVVYHIYGNKLILKKVKFSEIKSWDSQNFVELKSVFVKNCGQLDLFYKNKSFNDKFGSLEQWQGFCDGLNSIDNNNQQIKSYFEKLKIVQIKTFLKDKSLFTGYYSPILRGSDVKTDKYKYPLYKKPADLVSGNMYEFFPNNEDFRFKKIFARIDSENGKIYPYYTREEIENDGILSEKDVITWVDDKIDAFFLQIQGSGKVIVNNQGVINVGYSAQDGHKYYAIGAYLVEKGWLKQEEVSLQTIREFLYENPKKRDEILNQNPSYVFFDKKEDGPYGAFGITLEPNYSVAIDRNYIPLGLPLFVETETTVDKKPFNKMVFAQDVGGAINGEVRADIFFGEGDYAELYAGTQNNKGKMYVFSAKEL